MGFPLPVIRGGHFVLILPRRFGLLVIGVLDFRPRLSLLLCSLLRGAGRIGALRDQRDQCEVVGGNLFVSHNRI